MSTDHDISVDVINLSVISENDEETIIVDSECNYNFYQIGENIDDAAMRVKVQLTEYQRVLDCLHKRGDEHETVRCRLSKISQRKLSPQSKNKCQVCNVEINLENSSDFVTCSGCNHTICRTHNCASWKEDSNNWNCKLCSSFLNSSNSACDWLISQLNEKLLQGKGVDGTFQNKIVWDKSSSNDKSPLIPLEQREKVREFVEELVSTLIGGSIDDAPVSQLNASKEYLNLFSNYHSILSKTLHNLELSIRHVLFGLPSGENETDSIDRSHTNLKYLVERIIEEVFKIPDLFDHSGIPSQPQRINLPHFDPKKYEDLLATAVLNKIAESYNYERRLENSSGIHSGSDFESSSRFPKAQLETISTSSSNEPRSVSSISLTDQPMSLTITNYIDNLSPDHSPIDSPPVSPNSVGSNEEAYLSDYIQKHTVPLPSIDGNDLDSDSMDDDSQTLNETEGNWQENWLFKKRKLKNETATVIGMLVPSPMEDVKALIGDKTTDEVSDLSEAGSESDLDDDEKGQVNGNSADFSHSLIESKTVIGGKNDVGLFGEVKTIEELLQPDSLVSMQSNNNQSPIIMEAKNDLILFNESESKPVVLHLSEKVTNNNISGPPSVLLLNEDVRLQDSQIPESTAIEPSEVKIDIPKQQEDDRTLLLEEPPIPTPRKKSKSLERAASIEDKLKNSSLTHALSLTQIIATKTVKSSSVDIKKPTPLAADANLLNLRDGRVENPEMKSIPSSLEDEFLDSSINDIYDSIEGVSTLDYQLLVAEEEKLTNDNITEQAIQSVIFEASNAFVEDCLNETTQEICSEKIIVEPPPSESQTNAPNENYICKVAPTEYDLSMDNVFQSRSDILDVIPQSDDIEDKTIPKAVYMSSRPALIAVEIAAQQTPAIPTLIISKSITDTENSSSPIVTYDDDTSLQLKKVLKAQDSLELPKDDKDKFGPSKRVDSFESDDASRIDGKLGTLENVANSSSDDINSNPKDSLELERDVEHDESFIIVTEEEKEALKHEEREYFKKSAVNNASDVNANALEKIPVSEIREDVNTKGSDSNLKEHYRTYASIQVSTSSTGGKTRSRSLPIEKEPTEDVTTSSSETLKRSSLSTPTKEFSPLLPSIGEFTSPVGTVTQSYTNITSTFQTNESIPLFPATNTLQLNEYGDLPGSIAEREHLKWKNAQDIPNNPYSAEALQRRLSQTKNQSKVIDISHLATKQIDDQSFTTDSEDSKSLKTVLGAGKPDHSRYSRDYYINDAKTGGGTRKQTASHHQYSSTEDDNTSPKPTTPDSEVFTAKIVHIKDDSDHLSDDSTKLKISISNSSSIQSDSLTLSDDSESTRVYDLRKNETHYLRNDIIRTSRNPVGAAVTPPSTPTDGDVTLTKNLDQFLAIKQLNQLKKSEEEQEHTSQTSSQTHIGSSIFTTKPLSPDTVNFLAPKPKPVYTSKIKMEEVISIKPLVLERESIDAPQNEAAEKAVIEEDVIPSLPSVKALAKSYLENQSAEATPPIQRPKSFTWQVSQENGNSSNVSVKGPSPDSRIPLYESAYHPVAVGHSITARSLSTKFREELKHSISDDTSNGTDIEIVERQRDHSPDRPPSPVLLKGIFKEKMSFFQNLETK